MAIQVRRGFKSQFDPSKLLPGELASPLDTKELYAAFAPGDVKRIATYEDMQDNINQATEEIILELTEGVAQAINSANNSAEYAAEQGYYAKEQGDKAIDVVDEFNSILDGKFGINDNIVSKITVWSSYKIADIYNTLYEAMGVMPIDGGTFFENYTEWEHDGGTF